MFGSKKKIEQRDRAIDFKRCFGTPEGKRVLFHLMDRNYIINPLPAAEGDVFKIGKAEGQRAVVCDILKWCSIDIKQLDEMIKGENS